MINFVLYFEADALAIIFERSWDIFLGAKEAINLPTLWMLLDPERSRAYLASEQSTLTRNNLTLLLSAVLHENKNVDIIVYKHTLAWFLNYLYFCVQRRKNSYIYSVISHTIFIRLN